MFLDILIAFSFIEFVCLISYFSICDTLGSVHFSIHDTLGFVSGMKKQLSLCFELAVSWFISAATVLAFKDTLKYYILFPVLCNHDGSTCVAFWCICWRLSVMLLIG